MTEPAPETDRPRDPEAECRQVSEEAERLPADIRRQRAAFLHLLGFDAGRIGEMMGVSARTVQRDLETEDAQRIMRETLHAATGITGSLLALAAQDAATWLARILRLSIVDGDAEDSPTIRFAVKTAVGALVGSGRIVWPSRAPRVDWNGPAAGERVEDRAMLDWLRGRNLGPYHPDAQERAAWMEAAEMNGSPFAGARAAWGREMVRNGGAAIALEE